MLVSGISEKASHLMIIQLCLFQASMTIGAFRGGSSGQLDESPIQAYPFMSMVVNVAATGRDQVRMVGVALLWPSGFLAVSSGLWWGPVVSSEGFPLASPLKQLVDLF